MSSKPPAIRVQNVGKCYEMYSKPHHRLLQTLCKGHRKFYKEFWALRNISFDVAAGETVGIIGRNGSGKSTLLQMICGTLAPTNGCVTANGRIAALLELGSGFNPEFTGRENVFMNGTVLGLSRKEVAARFNSIIEFADIGEFIEQPVKTYSSGMMVRLAFAVAINVDPQILIVDEALSVGDEAFQRKCFARIEEIKKNGATILFCSHSGGTIVNLCDRALMLDAGKKLAIGNPKRIFAEYQKLIYAPADKRASIRRAIEAADLTAAESVAPADEPNREKEEEPAEVFNEHLKPKSTVEYESHGPLIHSPRILTLDGKSVNGLIRGRTYRYTYQVDFKKQARHVRFGMLIKTISGVALGGAATAPGNADSIASIQAGQEATVEFIFRCNLNPGTYFLNAGVTGTPDDEETYLHRIIDFCMFKVLPVENNTSTGMIDFNCKTKVKFLSDLASKN